MEPALWTLFTLLLTGITALAYKEPEAFGRLDIILSVAIGIWLFVGYAYNFGVDQARHALFPVFDMGKHQFSEIDSLTSSVKLPVFKALILPLLVTLYLSVLSHLHHMGIKPKDATPKEP